MIKILGASALSTMHCCGHNLYKWLKLWPHHPLLIIVRSAPAFCCNLGLSKLTIFSIYFHHFTPPSLLGTNLNNNKKKIKKFF